MCAETTTWLGLAQRTNGNSDACGRVRRAEHEAATIEDSARVNHKTGRVDFSGHDALGLNFHAALREDYAVIASGDDNSISFDLPFDFGIFAEDQRLLGNHISLQA